MNTYHLQHQEISDGPWITTLTYWNREKIDEYFNYRKRHFEHLRIRRGDGRTVREKHWTRPCYAVGQVVRRGAGTLYLLDNVMVSGDRYWGYPLEGGRWSERGGLTILQDDLSLVDEQDPDMGKVRVAMLRGLAA